MASPRLTPVFYALLSLAISGCSLIGDWATQEGPSESTRKEGVLADCPKKPNCVSTQARDTEHAIVPFTYSLSIEVAREALKRLMADMPRTSLAKEEGPYLHFEYRSKVLRVVDDIEFYFDEPSKTLQFRSASRFGFSDWNSNRQRMEDIRNRILGRI